MFVHYVKSVIKRSRCSPHPLQPPSLAAARHPLRAGPGGGEVAAGSAALSNRSGAARLGLRLVLAAGEAARPGEGERAAAAPGWGGIGRGSAGGSGRGGWEPLRCANSGETLVGGPPGLVRPAGGDGRVGTPPSVGRVRPLGTGVGTRRCLWDVPEHRLVSWCPSQLVGAERQGCGQRIKSFVNRYSCL